MKLRSPESFALALALGLAAAAAARAQPPAIVQQETDHLIRVIRESGCEFERNGVWSDSETAEAHVHAKSDFLVRRGAITTAEDFIDKAATRSSLSGRGYEIRCEGGAPMPSNLWLGNELERYRASRQHLR